MAEPDPYEVLDLLRALAAEEPTYEDDFLNTWCVYCHGQDGRPGEGFKHEVECPWVQAHDLLVPVAGGTQ